MASSPKRPVICTPMGRPEAEVWSGTLMAGWPVWLKSMVLPVASKLGGVMASNSFSMSRRAGNADTSRRPSRSAGRRSSAPMRSGGWARVGVTRTS